MRKVIERFAQFIKNQSGRHKQPAWFNLTSALLAIGLALNWTAPANPGILGNITGGV